MWIVGNGQHAPQRAVEERRLRCPEGKDRKRDARQGQRRIVQPHLIVTGRRAAEVVERPVAGRLCGEDCVLYAHFLRPELASVPVRAVGTQRTSAIRQNAGRGATEAMRHERSFPERS